MFIRCLKVALVTLLGLIMCSFVIQYYSYIVPCRKVLPKAAIIGAPKCGTGALQKFLELHPDIDIGPFKDPNTGADQPTNNFFTTYYDKGFEWYKNILPCSEPGNLTIDSAPWNVFHKQVPERMHRYNNTLKLLIILREPVARSVSEYLQDSATKMNFNKSMSVDEYLLAALAEERAGGDRNAIGKSVYVKHLRIWFQYFKREQLYIVDGDEFAKQPLIQLKEMEHFLGVKPFLNSEIIHFSETKGFYCVTTNNLNVEKCLSKGKGRPHPQIKQALLNKLKYYFKPYNEKLFKLIGQRFNWN